MLSKCGENAPQTCGKVSRGWESVPQTCGKVSQGWESVPQICGKVSRSRESLLQVFDGILQRINNANHRLTRDFTHKISIFDP